MVQFIPGDSRLFMVLTNAGDLHEYDALQGIALKTYSCKVDIINGLGCFAIKRLGKKIITIAEKGEVRIVMRMRDR